MNKQMSFVFLVGISVVGLIFGSYLFLSKGLFETTNNQDWNSNISTKGLEVEAKDKNLFPDKIGNFVLSKEGRREESDCETYIGLLSPGMKGEFCWITKRAEYNDANSNRGVFVIGQKFTKGGNSYKDYLKTQSKPLIVDGEKVFRLEDHELYWWTSHSSQVDLILTQEFTVNKYSNIDKSYKYGMAYGDNQITKYLLEQFPPE